MNFMSFHGFLRKINSVVILKFPKRMLEYYSEKGFAILECNYNDLEKLSNEVKQIIYSEETENSDKVMTCINNIPSENKTLNNLVINKNLHSSYIKT